MPLLGDDWMEWAQFDEVNADLSAGNISAPDELVEGLEPIVDHAASNGVDLSIVITDQEVGVYSQARDMATRLSNDHEGTIVVFTPDYVGSHSDSISRSVLESAQDDAYREDHPIEAAAVFEARITQPAPPWGLYATGTVVLIIVLIVVFVLAIKRRAQGQ